MKLRQIILTNGDVVGSTKEAAISTSITYSKTYELLHKQLWRKNRVVTTGKTIYLNGRACKAIRFWNIKSPSINPYNYDNVNDLGLNQLFMKQNPYEQYQGNPRDGIYLDDCYIYPKAKEVSWVTSHDVFGWEIKEVHEYPDDGGSAYSYEFKKNIKKYDDWGILLVDNVIIEEEFETNALEKLYLSTGELYREYIYNYKNNILTVIINAYDIETGEIALSTTNETFTTSPNIPNTVIETDSLGNTIRSVTKSISSLGRFLKTFLNGVLLSKEQVVWTPSSTTLATYMNLTAEKNVPKYMNVDFAASGFGEPIYAENISDVNYAMPSLNSITAEGNNDGKGYAVTEVLKSLEYSRVYVFTDGTTIQLIPPYSYSIDLGGADQEMISSGTLNAQIMNLPLVYLDTGDLIQNKYDFIDDWDENFGLYLHENSKWYKSFFKAVVFVASVVIGYMTAGVGFQAVGAMFGAMGALGSMRGIKELQVIGAAGGLFTAGTGMLQDNLTKTFVANGFTQEGAKAIAEDMLLNMSMKEMFKAYASTAGLSNLLSAGKSMFSIYQTMGIEEIQASYTEEESTTRMTGMTQEEDQPFNDYINKVISLPLKI